MDSASWMASRTSASSCIAQQQQQNEHKTSQFLEYQGHTYGVELVSKLAHIKTYACPWYERTEDYPPVENHSLPGSISALLCECTDQYLRALNDLPGAQMRSHKHGAVTRARSTLCSTLAPRSTSRSRVLFRALGSQAWCLCVQYCRLIKAINMCHLMLKAHMSQSFINQSGIINKC